MRGIMRANTSALRLLLLAVAVGLAGLVGCFPAGGPSRQVLTVYSSRAQSLVHPVLDRFATETGIDLQVRYDTTAGLVATLNEEGQNSPADVLYLGESSGLAELSHEGRLITLPTTTMEKVDKRFRSPRNEWIGVSGRSKVLVYNTKTIDPQRDLPTSIMDFTDPKWKGRLGWSPTHGEWQLTVTAIRLVHGEDAARKWVEGIKANQPRVYPSLVTTVQAAADGEIDVGFVNHYYVPRFISQNGSSFGARNAYLRQGDAGALIDVAGVGIVKTSKNQDSARRFVDYLLAEDTQKFFSSETFEYPLSAGVATAGELPPLASLDPPSLDPDELADLPGTLNLLRSTGVLP
jgi:iron(III) transport system substrate-binding protein